MKLKLSIVLFMICTSIFYGQKNKITFVKKVPIKIKSDNSYSFFLGYDVEKDSDIAIDFSGGPKKFWAGKTVPVAKGKGIVEIKVGAPENPSPGKGYKVIASIRKRGGDWKTTKIATSINNVEVTKSQLPILDDASFAASTPFIIPSKDQYTFDIDYVASQKRMIVVAIYNQGKWMGASKTISVEKGKGTQQVRVAMNPLIEGNQYRFVLYFGSGEGFPNTNIVSKEISGIEVTKPEKKLTISDLREKSILLSLNKSSEVLTLPGNSKYESFQIIGQNGKAIIEAVNTNTILISDLPKGGYFIVTSEEDYFQFIKF